MKYIRCYRSWHKSGGKKPEQNFFNAGKEGFFSDSRSGSFFQPKLTIGKPNDKYEKEADAVADRVVTNHSNALMSGSTDGFGALQTKCEECENEGGNAIQKMGAEEEEAQPKLQRQEEEELQTMIQKQEEKEEESIQRQEEEEEMLQMQEEEEMLQPKRNSGETTASAGLNNQLTQSKGSGSPMTDSTRQAMEQAIGADFSRVRIHTGSPAVQMNRQLNAQAFTHGSDIYFNKGKYNPDTKGGKHLLAHELTHVVQQNSQLAKKKIQKQDNSKPAPKAVKKTDVVLNLGGGITVAAAEYPGAKHYRVTTLAQLSAVLKKINFPVGTVMISSHSLTEGDIGFTKGDTTSYKRPADVAKAIKGNLKSEFAPSHVDFRGCSLGSTPSGMDTIRAAFGAKSAIAGNCFMISQVSKPIKIGRTTFTRKSQLTARNKKAFEGAYQKLVNLYGENKKKCILNPGIDGYFKAGGRVIVQWSSPSMDAAWDQRKSKCYRDMEVVKAKLKSGEDYSPGLAQHCKLIRIEGNP